HRHCLAALIALGNNPRLLLRTPRPPPTGPGKHLQPPNGVRLRFGQKLSVRHVSNPLDAAALTVADHHTEIKVGSKGRLRLNSAGARLIPEYQQWRRGILT